jgi:predicted transposase/invertase (TIGR01784 family)
VEILIPTLLQVETRDSIRESIRKLKNSELPFKARKAVFQKLEKIVDIASLTKEEREKYDESIKVYRDHLATLAYAKQEGVIAVAREMKKAGVPIEQIARFTKLSIQEIEKL